MSTELARGDDSPSRVSHAGPDGPRRMRRWTVAATVVAAGGLVTVLAFTAGPGLGSGPISPPPNPTYNGLSVKIGDSISWGGSYLMNDSDQPVTLRSAEVLRADTAGAWPRLDRIEAIDPSTAQSGIGTAEGDGYSTIAKDLRRPVDGFQIEPGKYVNVIAKFTAVAQGAWRYEGVRITYESDGRTYAVDLPQKFALCVDTPGDCTDE